MERTINCMFESRLLSVHLKSKSNVFLRWAVFLLTQLRNLKNVSHVLKLRGSVQMGSEASLLCKRQQTSSTKLKEIFFKAFYFLIKTKKTANLTGIQPKVPGLLV